MNVYYGTTDNSFLEEIVPLSKNIFNSVIYTKEMTYAKCPAFKEYINNTFVVQSPIDLKIRWDKEEGKIYADATSSSFIKNNILIRDSKNGLVSLLYPKLLFFSEQSLDMELTHPFFHLENSKYFTIPGSYNIGKHFRKIEKAIHFSESTTITINELDPLYYLRFLTKEQIIFKRIYISEKLNGYTRYFHDKRVNVKRIIPLTWYYERSLKKEIIKEIQKNLVEI